MVTLIQFGANVIRQCVSTQPFHWFMQDHAAFLGYANLPFLVST
jgi:hypothetical protein